MTVLTFQQLLQPTRGCCTRRAATISTRSSTVMSRPGHLRPRIACQSSSKSASQATDTARAALENPWAAPGYKGAVVSQLPQSSQGAVFAAIAVAIAAGTFASCTTIGPAISSHLPSFLQVHRGSWFPLGPIFTAAGIAHFTEEKGFKAMYPHQGAWGFWHLPGSPQFHVYWTGVAEILGGMGLTLGALPFEAIPSWLSPASAYGLFLLTAVVTPANIYMYTHNAPGPIPESVSSEVIPWQGHLARGFMQVLLLATLWGIATATS